MVIYKIDKEKNIYSNYIVVRDNGIYLLIPIASKSNKISF